MTLGERLRSGFEHSLLAKTLVLVGLAAALVAGLVVVVTLGVMHDRVERQALTRLNTLIDASGAMASAACFAQDAILAAETAQAFVLNSEVREVVIVSDGRELARARRKGAQTETPATRPRPPLARTIFSPFDARERIGDILVHPDWDEIARRVNEEARYATAFLAAVMAGLVGLIGLVVTVLVVRPVKLISDRVHSMDAAAGERLLVPQEHAKDELGRLVSDFNDLVGRFRASLQQEHELNLQRVISEKLQLAAEVFENSQEGIMVTDGENRIVTVNPAFTAITGFTEADVSGQNPRILSSGRQTREFYDEMWAALLRDGFWRGEIWNRRKDGEVIPKWFSINTVRDAAGVVVNHVAIFSDISERKDAEEKIEFLAHHDPLTKLPNRVLLRDRFSQACSAVRRNKTRMAVFFLDLDNFKHINDSYGHHTGDQVLIQVVSRLSQFIRFTDTVCRQGGDEFIVILPEIRDIETLTRIAQNVLDALAIPISVEGREIDTSASIGISLYPDDGEDFETLLRNADAAMYDAKLSGKNAYRFFTDKMNTAALDKSQLRSSLHDALRNNEFVLHYQPQIDLLTERVTGVEALIRWIHPEMGEVAPDRFIPLAEEFGLIIPIGKWVLEEACRQGKQWASQGIAGLTVTVNISALQFNRGILLDTVKGALRQSGFDPTLLELELTESVLLHDMASTLSTIRELKKMGIKLSIDDFGTGYSSLSYLKQIKVDKLKIDQTFIRDICDDADDLAIVHAIIQLGKTLQLRIIAEGVANAQQLDILRHYGCDEVQGFHCGVPMPPDKVTALLQSPAPTGFGQLDPGETL